MGCKLKWSRHEDLAIKRQGEILSRDEYISWMKFQGGRAPFTEIFGPLLGLKEAWEEQGASPEELDFSAFKYRFPLVHSLGVATGRLDAWTKKESEDGSRILYKDDLGRTLELAKGAATIPLPCDYPVKGIDGWLKIKPKYQFDERRFQEGWLEAAKKAQGEGRVVSASIPGGFDEPRQLLGEEALCYAFYDQPELVADILNTIAETAFKTLERASREIRIDVLYVHEDMAGKSGPLIGPREIEAFVKPYFRKVWDMLSERGASLFEMDSDGNMNPIIDALLDTGLNCLHPMEPAAGMDVVKTRELYGRRLSFAGGIDKFVLSKGKDEIDRELERKLPPLLKSQGCVIALDHRIPAETPLESYRHYVKRAWEIIEAHERGEL